MGCEADNLGGKLDSLTGGVPIHERSTAIEPETIQYETSRRTKC